MGKRLLTALTVTAACLLQAVPTYLRWSAERMDIGGLTVQNGGSSYDRCFGALVINGTPSEVRTFLLTHTFTQGDDLGKSACWIGGMRPRAVGSVLSYGAGFDENRYGELYEFKAVNPPKTSQGFRSPGGRELSNLRVHSEDLRADRRACLVFLDFTADGNSVARTASIHPIPVSGQTWDKPDNPAVMEGLKVAFEPDTEYPWLYAVGDGGTELVTAGGYPAWSAPADGTAVTVPASLGGAPVTAVGDRAFDGARGIVSADLSAAPVRRIGTGAFRNMPDLTSVTLPAGCTDIAQGAFSGCTALTSVTLPADMTAVRAETFAGCTALERIVLPEGVTSVAAGAFAGCTALKTVVLPSTLTYLGADAFRDCPALDAVTLTFSPAVAFVHPEAFSGITRAKGVVPADRREAWSSVDGPVWNGLTLTHDAALVRVSADAVGRGSVTGGGLYGKGEAVTLTAEPSGGALFAGWRTGGRVLSANPLVLPSVTADTAAEALFADTAVYTARTEDSVLSAEAALEQALAERRLFLRSDLHRMAFGAPGIRVSETEVGASVSLKTAAPDADWEALDLSKASVGAADAARGVLRVTVPGNGRRAAFYTFVGDGTVPSAK